MGEVELKLSESESGSINELSSKLVVSKSDLTLTDDNPPHWYDFYCLNYEI